ncbi:hypothetical protein KIW84_050253 [Lathyrus oleraceus]|uniref:BURP domain-containing protein n=1 Tax=Pisum sativum TaxID=3888 RepID=A0A9D5ABU3_PEA|nr:hypothetical protein KIW84_050253 [Pisum sativum]
MTHIIVMFLLPFFLLLLINGHGNFARDMNQGNQPYLDGWLKNTQLKNQKSSPNSDQVYLDGWLKDTRDEKAKSTPDSNQVYVDGWLKDTLAEKAKLNSDSNQVYLDGWLKDTRAEKAKSSLDSNEVYLDGWLKDTRVEKLNSNHNSNQVYLDGWLKDTQTLNPKPTLDSNQVYLDGWLKDTRAEKDNSSPNSNRVYLDGWLKDSHVEIAKSTPNSKQAYLDGWLKDSHAENYMKNGQHLEESNGKLSSKVDHTEAFKVAFFSLDDLYVGNVMTLQFPIREYAPFLPRKLADEIPVSKSQSSSLLQLFSLTKDSPHGEDMIDVMNQCESEPNKGETKACPTSLESMLEFVHGVIGAETNYNIHSTSYPTTSGAPLQNYTVLDISKDIYAPKWVACHPRPYPYALYYCHYLDIGSKIFKVLLKGEYGDIMDALGICHLDTSAMNPNHFIFDLLGMKPGEGPLCHFFPVKHVLWVPSPPHATK